MLLYSKEGWIITTSTRLLETKPVYNKEQDAIILNWEVIDKLKETRYFNKLNLI